MIMKKKPIAARFPKGGDPLCVIIVIIELLILFVSFFSPTPLSAFFVQCKKIGE